MTQTRGMVMGLAGEVFAEGERPIELIREEALQNLKAELDLIEFDPPDGDPFISSYAYAFMHLLEDRQLADYWMTALYRAPNGEEPEHYRLPDQSEVFNKIYKSIQRLFLQRGTQDTFELPEIAGVDYPGEFADKERCLTVLRGLLYGPNSPHVRAEMFVDLRGREIMSNVEERYKSAAVLLGSYWSEQKGRRFLDVGSSAGLGMAMLLKPRSVSWEKTEVVADVEDPESPRIPQAERFINELARRHVAPSSLKGVDIWSANDPIVRLWVESCSFYPHELLDARRRHRFNTLLKRVNDPRISFVLDNFTEESLPDQLIADGGQFDLVFRSAVSYQMNERDEQKANENALRCIKPDGLDVVQDFFDLDESRQRFVRRNNWYDGPFYTYVREAAHPERGWQELFAWENGRCHKLQLGRDAANIIKPLAA